MSMMQAVMSALALVSIGILTAQQAGKITGGLTLEIGNVTERINVTEAAITIDTEN